MKRCDFLSLRRMEATPGSPNVCVISLNDYFRPPARLKPGFREVLVLKFNDTYCGDWGDGIGNPELHHAQNIVTFIRRNADCDTFIVHCVAGQCRSAAVALLLDELGWKLADRRRAFAANPRLVCLLAEAANVVIPLPHEATPSQPESGPLLWE